MPKGTKFSFRCSQSRNNFYRFIVFTFDGAKSIAMAKPERSGTHRDALIGQSTVMDGLPGLATDGAYISVLFLKLYQLIRPILSIRRPDV